MDILGRGRDNGSFSWIVSFLKDSKSDLWIPSSVFIYPMLDVSLFIAFTCHFFPCLCTVISHAAFAFLHLAERLLQSFAPGYEKPLCPLQVHALVNLRSVWVCSYTNIVLLVVDSGVDEPSSAPLMKVNLKAMTYVSDHIGSSWHGLARHLNWPNNVDVASLIREIDTDLHNVDVKDRAFSMLDNWSNTLGKSATLDLLEKALIDCGKTDLSQKLRQFTFA